MISSITYVESENLTKKILDPPYHLKLLGSTKKCHPQVGGWIDKKSLFFATMVGQTGIFVTLRHVVRRV